MKRILVSAFLLLAFFGLAASKVNAQNQAVPERKTLQDNIINDTATDNISLDSWNLRFDSSKLYNVGLFITGLQDDQGNSIVKGVVPDMGRAMAYMIEQPPASAERWIADLINDSPFLADRAYAQGIGFSSLNPVLEVWKVFRDIAYGVFVLIFIALGFMIMFRRKLGAQSVVTITSALPNIAVTLLLITFSYAICGLIIDLMYVVIYFIAGVFQTLIGSTWNTYAIALDYSIFTNGLKMIFGNQGVSLEGMQSSVVGGIGGAIGDMVTDLFELEKTDSPLALLLGGWFGDAVGILGFVIIAIAIFFVVMKTFIELLKSYVTFIIGVVFSPFQLLLAALKGNSEFVQWFKNMVGTLAPFPVVITMIYLAMVFGGQSNREGVGYRWNGVETGVVGFQPPLITVGDSQSAIQGLIALGILMLIPEAIKMSGEWIGTKNPLEKYMGSIGKNLEKGWKGGNLIDGLGFTDTNKLPLGGLSGQNIARKSFMLGSGAVGSAAGALYHAPEGPSGLARGIPRATRMFYGAAGEVTKDPTYADYKKRGEEAEKKNKDEQKAGSARPSSGSSRGPA